ncbi:MAG TPA: hypothetical protein VHE55_01735 [Fimbriimonadaceae bacterium]|nr:hypothetical protein [Fimbriimonadaceae bacterium]
MEESSYAIGARRDRPIVIDGLWGLSSGNGHLAGNAGKLYFTAGPNGEDNGLFGYIAATRGRWGGVKGVAHSPFHPFTQSPGHPVTRSPGHPFSEAA